MKKFIVLAFLAFPLVFSSCDDEVETMIIDSSLPQGDFNVEANGQFSGS